MNATLVLTRRDMAALMAPADYLAAVETGFRALHAGACATPHPLHLPAVGGGFHAKGALLPGARAYAALKFNGNFPGNAARALPTIQGALLLSDAQDGSLLAIMDSAEITMRRTAAASALAARLLAKADARTLLLCGCGVQGRAHAEAMAPLFALDHIWCWDADPARAAALASEIERRLGAPAQSAVELDAVAQRADLIVTATTAATAFLGPEHVSPGCFVAAVGADSPSKSEIFPALMGASRIVVDDQEQCAAMGDLRVAIGAGALARDAKQLSLGELVVAPERGRKNPDEAWILDSTGLAIEDVASAAALYERATAAGVGLSLDLQA